MNSKRVTAWKDWRTFESSKIAKQVSEVFVHFLGLCSTSLIGLSRQFGFLHFSSVDAAKLFLERNYPCIQLYGSSPGGVKNGDAATKVRISFCRERDDRDRPAKLEDDWICLVVR